MRFLNGITILLICQLLGEATSVSLDLPVPGPVLGMLLLFAALSVRRGVPESMESASTALLSHLSLLFVPAGVGLMVHFDRVSEEWLPIAVTLLLSTVISLVATALIMKGAMKLFGQRGDENA